MRETDGRRLTWPVFLVVVVGYLVILQGVALLLKVDVPGAETSFPTAEAVVRSGVVPIGLSVLYAAAVVTWLGWWPQVMRCRVPVRRWVWLVPVAMILAALVAIDYGHLAGQPVGLVAGVAVMALLVGVGEELMFRGLGVTVFRRAGFSEGKVALYSSVVFGLVHVSNIISEGPGAIVQAVVVSTSGYFFYLCLRVGGTLLLPMLVHGLWDFSLLSGMIGAKGDHALGFLVVILVQVALIVVLLVRRRRVEPVAA